MASLRILDKMQEIKAPPRHRIRAPLHLLAQGQELRPRAHTSDQVLLVGCRRARQAVPMDAQVYEFAKRRLAIDKLFWAVLEDGEHRSSPTHVRTRRTGIDTRSILVHLHSTQWGPKRTPASWAGVHGILQGTGARCRPGCRDGAGPVPGTRRVPAAAATLQSLELRGTDEGLQRASRFQRSCACFELVLELSNPEPAAQTQAKPNAEWSGFS